MDTVEERAATLGAYIIEHNATVREAAKRFGISKSTVHKDVTFRLRSVNPSLYSGVRAVLEKNKSERTRANGIYAAEWQRVRNTEKNLYNPRCLLYNVE